MPQIYIGISYAPDKKPYQYYGEAVRQAAERIGVTVGLVNLVDDPTAMDFIDGIVFTGGGDIDPARYGRQDARAVCHGIDDARDKAELSLWHVNGTPYVIPTLAICRGMQLINVAEGGTLIPHIARAEAHGRRPDDSDGRHDIVFETGDLWETIEGDRANVNSSHHQAVDRLADVFVATARADDGTIEAYEWANPDESCPPLVAVQWHPERMRQDEPLAGALFEWLLTAAMDKKQTEENAEYDALADGADNGARLARRSR
jgi:putative glutamine amidotransferase